jgi:DNA helicase HerA-like ATPase
MNDVKAYPGPRLFIVVSENPDRLRGFFAMVGDALYNERRKRGLSTPPVLFIVDEADEFVGAAYGENGSPPSMRESRSAAETIARRGRKLGIGIGIATQRAAYIDTKLMGQLHTYFVSKLPRKSDRERVAEAFGIPLSTIDRTLALRSPRQWLVISHSSLELHATPYFVTFESRVQQVRAALQGKSA